jgi:uncharacterized membrane protein YkoI
MPTRLLIVALVFGSGCREKSPLKPARLPITIEQARAAALAAVPGHITHEEVDFETKRWLYEFEIQPARADLTKQEVDVDAMTGAVVTVKPDD